MSKENKFTNEIHEEGGLVGPDGEHITAPAISALPGTPGAESNGFGSDIDNKSRTSTPAPFASVPGHAGVGQTARKLSSRHVQVSQLHPMERNDAVRTHALLLMSLYR